MAIVIGIAIIGVNVLANMIVVILASLSSSSSSSVTSVSKFWRSWNFMNYLNHALHLNISWRHLDYIYIIFRMEYRWEYVTVH